MKDVEITNIVRIQTHGDWWYEVSDIDPITGCPDVFISYHEKARGKVSYMNLSAPEAEALANNILKMVKDAKY